MTLFEIETVTARKKFLSSLQKATLFHLLLWLCNKVASRAMNEGLITFYLGIVSLDESQGTSL
jgi:hypothetical protein